MCYRKMVKREKFNLFGYLQNISLFLYFFLYFLTFIFIFNVNTEGAILIQSPLEKNSFPVSVCFIYTKLNFRNLEN